MKPGFVDDGSDNYHHLFLLAVEIGIEGPAEVARWVIEAELLVEAVDLLNVGRIELEIAFQVSSDSLGSFRLREDGALLDVSRLDPCLLYCNVGQQTS